MRRLSLLAYVAVVTLLASAVLGAVLVVVVTQRLGDQVRHDAELLAQAVANARVITERGPQDFSATEAWPTWHAAHVDHREGVAAIRVWTRDHLAVSDSTRRFTGRVVERHGPLAGALDGRVVSVVAPDGVAAVGDTGVRTLAVFVPVRYGDGSAVVGAVEVHVDQAAARARLAAVTWQVSLVVAGSMAVLWVLLMRVVWGASRRLREQADENARLALTDPLTGLPNRRLFQDRLERAVLHHRRTDAPVALLLLDLDRFKEINDTLGHDWGDRLLLQVGERLRGVVRETDTVARLGGDEFAVLLEGCQSLDDAVLAALRVREAFEEPFSLDGLDLPAEPSIGLAVLPHHADDAVALMRHADVAMYEAKAAHSGVNVYEPDGDAHSPSRLLMLSDLRHALDQGGLDVHFQPKVGLPGGEVVGLEALLRWDRPGHGPVSPGEFVPLAESTGLIDPLTRFVVARVVAQIAAWQECGTAVPVAVNVSARNMLSGDLVETVRESLDQWGVDPAFLEIEVTESSLISDPARVATVLRALSSMGVTLSVDDFGTGYTSMSQLQQMPLDTLKIDRSFVARMLEDESGGVLVRSIIDLAHDLGMRVVAEGVETHDASAELAELGCDVAQGYLYSRAIPAADVPALLERLRAAAAPIPHDGRAGAAASVPSTL